MQATQTFATLFGSQQTEERADVDADAADDDDDAGANVVGERHRDAGQL